MHRTLLFVAVLALSAPVSGDDVKEPLQSLKEQITTSTADYRQKRPFGALAVGVIQNGQREAFGFGEITHQDQKTPVDGRTIFEIGSCTKVFTSLSLAVLVARGDLKLEDPIGSILPKEELSEDAAKITLKELSTHTSGLPRIPVGLYFDAIFNSDNPYKDFGADRLMSTLKAWDGPEKKTSLYSNLGAGLLGYVIQQKEHADSYQALIASTITQPLRMPDTVVTLSDEQKSRFSTGHNVEGEPVSHWDWDGGALSGAGALRSSADDMLTLLENQLHPEKSPLQEAIELSQQKHDPRGRCGLGWQISERDGQTLIRHNGATGGYRSFMGFNRQRGVGIVLLSNTGDAYAQDSSLDQMGMKLLQSFSEHQ